MHLHPCFLSFFSLTIPPLSILHPADFISFHPPLSIKLHLLLHLFMLLVLPHCQPPSAHPSDLLSHPPSMHQSIDVPVHICVSTACYLAQIDSLLSLLETLTTLIPKKYQRPVTIYCRLSTMENQKEQMETGRTKSSAV